MTPAVHVREATSADWRTIFSIIRSVAGEQTTFAMDAEPREDDTRSAWMVPPPGRVVVAHTRDGEVIGTANMYANRPNQGAHVASGSLMVADTARGQGVGRALITDLIDWSRASGYSGIQFNAVVQSNAAAIHLYSTAGFRFIGSAPGAFHHPELGPVDLLMMWRDLP